MSGGGSFRLGLSRVEDLIESSPGGYDLIYIDPPYNTGKEFIYPDKYQDNLDTYLKVVQDRVETRAELATQRQSLRLTRERLVSYDPVVRGLESQLVRARSDLATLKEVGR